MLPDRYFSSVICIISAPDTYFFILIISSEPVPSAFCSFCHLLLSSFGSSLQITRALFYSFMLIICVESLLFSVDASFFPYVPLPHVAL